MGRSYKVYRPLGRGAGVAAFELVNVAAEQLDQLRRVIEPHLGAGFVAAVDGEIVARGPSEPSAAPPSDLVSALYEENLRRVHQLTEMAVQQHEYCCAELKRMRQEYEEDFAPERTALRALRQQWLERVCDDKVRSEDALRYVAEVVRSIAVKPSEPGGEPKT